MFIAPILYIKGHTEEHIEKNIHMEVTYAWSGYMYGGNLLIYGGDTNGGNISIKKI